MINRLTRTTLAAILAATTSPLLAQVPEQPRTDPTPPQGNGTPPTPEAEPIQPADPDVLDKPASGAGELILDAGELKTVFSSALEPLREHLEKSELDKKYAQINELLESDEVDGKKLTAALRSLRNELDSFVTGLPEIREKLFNGSDNLGDRIRDFRMVLARTRDAKDDSIRVDGHTDAMTALDDELTKIAREIKSAEDPRRKSLLKDRFKFLYLARKRIEQVKPAIGGLDESIMSNVLQFVVSIRAHLDNAATSTIAMQMGLQEQQRLVQQFVVLIENLQATDALAEEIEELSRIQAPNFEELTSKMNEVTRSLVGYTDKLEQKAGAATEKLAEKLTQAPVQGLVSDDLQLDRLIDEAANRGTANTPVEAARPPVDARPVDADTRSQPPTPDRR